MRVLVDTNVVIYLEDHRVIDRDVASFLQGCAENQVQIYIHKASYDDISRDADADRREIIESKLSKYPNIDLCPTDAEVGRYGTINSDNDYCDVCMLHAVARGAASILVTNDKRLLSRAERSGCGEWVFTPTEALEWLRDAFADRQIVLPRILDRTADQLDIAAPFFDSLREGYPGFDDWLRKCAEARRPCWTIEIGGQTEGLVILKDEGPKDAEAEGLEGQKVLKVCTFKLSERVRGIRYGEHLLKRVLWKYESEGYDLVYLTAYPEGQSHLLAMLTSFGFEVRKRPSNGEVVIYRRRRPVEPDVPARHTYPAFYEGEKVRKFLVPIQPSYHDILFPEIVVASPPSLFDAAGIDLSAHDAEQRGTPGNSIGKVYVSRTPANSLRSGDILVFYMSKSHSGSRISQVATGLGVVESMACVADLQALLKVIGKRCAIPNNEIERLMSDGRGAKAIDFLFLGGFEEPITLAMMKETGVIATRPPQSVCAVDATAYRRLRQASRLVWEPRAEALMPAHPAPIGV